jgi:hypothetical protein
MVSIIGVFRPAAGVFDVQKFAATPGDSVLENSNIKFGGNAQRSGFSVKKPL